MKEFDRPIVLASGSPRRRDLLSGMGCEFKTIVPDVDEHVDLPADQAVVCLAERKARAVAELCADSIVIACDTLVSLNGKALGKPSDAADARRMLRLLSGKAHDVYSGLCVIDSASMRSVLECVHSAVRFRVLTDAEICDYVATGEPMDKEIGRAHV